MTRIMHKRPLLCYLIIPFPLFHTLHLLSSMIIHPSCDWVPIHRPICWMTLTSLYKHLCRGLIQFQIGHFGAFLAYQLWYTRIPDCGNLVGVDQMENLRWANTEPSMHLGRHTIYTLVIRQTYLGNFYSQFYSQLYSQFHFQLYFYFYSHF